jgi:hypothetical protein
MARLRRSGAGFVETHSGVKTGWAAKGRQFYVVKDEPISPSLRMAAM